MTVRILTGDCRAMLRTLESDSVDCVVTSPPYWGLRDYACDGQLGIEPTLGEHIEAMVETFGEVRRVMKPEASLWLNYGDCYATSPNGRSAADTKAAGADDRTFRDKPFSTVGPIYRSKRMERGAGRWGGGNNSDPSLKPKDLCMVPHRLAIALQEDGWWVRQDIVWAKPNPMPESIGDRCTKAHEYIFLLTKNGRYYFDAAAIAEETAYPIGTRDSVEKGGFNGKTKDQSQPAFRAIRDTRNKRSVWTIPTDPFPEAHFATFPAALVEPCIAAGARKGGTVLDPFGGAGTVGLVADRMGRDAILIELNPAYVEIAERRIKGDCPMFATVVA